MSSTNDEVDNSGGRRRLGIGSIKSRARPIHLPPRQPLNETPDKTEPSNSYEEQSFLAYDREDDVVDEFHKQFAASSSGRHTQYHHGVSTGRDSSSLLRKNTNNDNVISDENGGGSNFWRTTSRQPSHSGSECGQNSGTNTANNKNRNGNGMRGGRGRLRSSCQTPAQRDVDADNNHSDALRFNNTKYNKNSSSKKNRNIYSNRLNIHKTKERKSTGILVGVAKKFTRGVANNNQQQQQRPSPPFPHSASASSLGSTGSNNNGDARLKSKQRDEIRRLKLDAQHQLGEDGGIVDNGYYTEVPTVNNIISRDKRNRNTNTNTNNSSNNDNTRGSRGNNTKMSSLEEEMSGDVYTTDDSDDNYENSVDNDGSHTFLHSNLRTTTATNNNKNKINNQVNAGDNITTTSSSNQQHQRIPSSTLLAAAAAVSEYRYYNTNSNRRDDRTPSLTHHINNIQQSSSTSQPQHQHEIPVVFALSPNDNTDSRSTTSTLSDLSMSESNTNHRQQHQHQHQHQHQQNTQLSVRLQQGR